MVNAENHIVFPDSIKDYKGLDNFTECMIKVAHAIELEVSEKFTEHSSIFKVLENPEMSIDRRSFKSDYYNITNYKNLRLV